MNNSKLPLQRMPYIDVARGIAMLLVIIGHSISMADMSVNKFILSFHMPLFFMLSGMTIKPTAPGSFVQYIIKYSKRLLLPQILLGFFFYLFYAFSDISHGFKMDMFMPQYLLYYITDAWFLLVMFQLIILLFLYRKWIYGSRWRESFFHIIIFIAAVLFQCFYHTKFFAYANLVPMAWIFYIIGFYIKKYLSKPLTLKTEILFILLLSVVFVLAQVNTPVRMYAADYGKLPVFLLTALVGSVSIIRLSHNVCSNFLEWCGRNCIMLYVYQFPTTMLFFKFVVYAMLKLQMTNIALQFGLIFMLSLTTTVLLTWISSKSKVMRFIFDIK